MKSVQFYKLILKEANDILFSFLELFNRFHP
jgi:hypothetical protein